MSESKQTESKSTTQSARINDLEVQLNKALGVIEGLQSRLSILDYQAEAVDRQRMQDPNECIKRARDIVERNRSFGDSTDKRYTWEIIRPGVHRAMYHNSDEGNRNAAIREWEERIGTKLVTNRHRDEENDSFTLFRDGLAEDGKD